MPVQENKRKATTSSQAEESPAPARVVIENLEPSVDDGRFAVKRAVGESVVVSADIFADGHDVLSAVLLYRSGVGSEWAEAPMRELGNDRWEGEFTVEHNGPYAFCVEGWVDAFRSWRRDFEKKRAAGQDDPLDVLAGAELVQASAERASGVDAKSLRDWASALRAYADPIEPRKAESQKTVLSDDMALLAEQYPDRRHVARSMEVPVWVDRRKARFSSWYEMFPRSAAGGGRHGTFRDCENWLDYVAGMGFDILYLPPIHPIGTTKRKGRNNDPVSTEGDPGSPWAIGGPEGGHKAVHPELGTLEDLRRLRDHAARLGIELALDIAFQVTPDHPYVREHEEWFRHRADGSIQYAENPPKKYEDIYPFDFESKGWRELWQELKSVFDFWLEQGISIFRVDNPHTKTFAFWEWAIAEIRKQHPEAIFLSEAFTRPKIMYRLAKLGFTQSYTYFTWRNTKWELTEYLTELTQTKVREFFNPNFWPNTPDILPEYLQYDGRAGFAARLVLAATLSSNYGIYGPAFELFENRPLAPGREQYLHSEKYEIRDWDRNRPDSLKDLIARVNRIRHGNPALQSNQSLRFYDIDNDQLIAYSKSTADLSNLILTVVNLDPFHKQSGWLSLPLEDLKLDAHESFQVHDLLADTRYFWQGNRNYVELNPSMAPAHIFLLRRRVRSERDFDYFM
jgi:starch synthase (maltosyl-transferring)